MPEIAIGTKLLHFQIQAELGRGGMGIVYQAWDERLDRSVAIKVLPEKAFADPKRHDRFVQEAKDASALKHANVITVHEIETVGDVTFIVMEYVEGQTLDKMIAKKKLPFTEALKYAVQIADALKAAHRRHIVHCDLKPANIMVSAGGVVKVLDFGLAQLARSERPQIEDSAGDAADPNRTASMWMLRPGRKSISGTVPYMSPEQARGEEIGVHSDIFSFGVILYEMLTGARPFFGRDSLETLDAIAYQAPVPAAQIVRGLPPELERVLMRCLQKDPERRFQTAADLHVALLELKEEFESGRYTLTQPPPRALKAIWVWPVVTAVAALTAWGIWVIRPSNPTLPQNIVPVTTYAGSAQHPSLSPDGNQVAFSWDGGKSGNANIYVKLLGDDSKPLRLTTDPASDRYPAWSPTGNRIAFDRIEANRSIGIYSVSPLGGSEQKISDFPSAGQIAWSPDAKWLAVSSNAPERTGIFLIPAEGGEPRRISTPHSPDFDTAPAFSKDGRLAYIHCAGPYSCDLFLQPLDSSHGPAGRSEQLTHQAMAMAGLAWNSDGKSLVYSGSAVGRAYYLWRLEIHKGQPQRLEVVGRNAYWPSIAAHGDRLVFSRLLRHFDIWRYQVGGGIDPIIPSLELDQNSPQFSPRGDRIAYESNRSGVEEIWVAEADGSHEMQLTNRLGRHQGTPRWSPDGRWIAFDSQGQDGHWDIYAVDATGGQPRRVTNDPGNENMPSWSRDGAWIYFTSDRTGRGEIWRIPAAGGQEEKITSGGAFMGFESGDGKSLLYLKNNSSPLLALPLSGGAEREILARVQSRAFAIAGDEIYFIGQQSEDGRYPLQLYRYSERSTRMLTAVEGPIGLGLTVSPDRKTILYTKSASVGARLDMIQNFQ